MNDTRVNQLIQSIQALKGKDIDNRLCEHLLYLMEEFSSKFSVEQIRSVFPVILNMGSFTERTLKLKWCLSIKEHLHECDVDLLLEKILLMSGYDEFNKDSDEIVCLISIHIESKLSDEQN